MKTDVSKSKDGDERCPNRGFCPHCGRSAKQEAQAPVFIPYPVPQPYPVYPQPYISPWWQPTWTWPGNGIISGSGSATTTTTPCIGGIVSSSSTYLVAEAGPETFTGITS